MAPNYARILIKADPRVRSRVQTRICDRRKQRESPDWFASRGERDDLADDRPDQRRALRRRLDTWLDDIDAPRPEPV